jgi:hypothetical protein
MTLKNQKYQHTTYMVEWRKKNKAKSLEQSRLAQRRFYHWNKIIKEFGRIDCSLFN